MEKVSNSEDKGFGNFCPVLPKRHSRKRTSSYARHASVKDDSQTRITFTKPDERIFELSTPGKNMKLFDEMAAFAVQHELYPVALSAIIKSNEIILISGHSDPLKFIVDQLTNVMSELKKHERKLNQAHRDADLPSNQSLESLFRCPICKNIMSDPVSITCGHSYCRTCVSKSCEVHCHLCEASTFYDVDQFKSNVLLSKLIDTCFASNATKAKLKEEGNIAMRREQFQVAIEKYSKALSSDSDHILLSNRSCAYSRLGMFKEALQDSEKVISLRPDWPKGYFRRGASFLSLDQPDEAAASFARCLRLDPSIEAVKSQLKEALTQLYGGTTADLLRLTLLAEQCSPLLSSNFTELLSNLTCFTFNDLKSATSAQELSALLTTCQSCHLKPTVGSMRKNTSCHSLKEMDTAASSDDGCGFGIQEFSSGQLKPAISVDDMRLESLKKDEQLARDQKILRFLNKDDFECSLCLRMLYDPVTTRCGHVFCRQCLERSLDHKPCCPLCQGPLTNYFSNVRTSVTQVFLEIMRISWPQEYLLRKQAHDEEMDELARAGSDQLHDIPVFLCTLAFPSLPCPLHVFEPRYRLMVRRCMESGTRQFGMTIPTDSGEGRFHDVGTVLEIRHIEYLPDGRSILDTRGNRRFKVLERSMRDGYNTAKVEYITDYPVPADKLPYLNILCNQVRGLAGSWFDSLASSTRAEISKHYGTLPPHETASATSEQGPAWLWWLAAVLPVEPKIQILLLQCRSLETRLNIVQKILSVCVTKNRKTI